MSIRNILVAFNGSDAAVTALKYAASLATSQEAHVTAVLAHSTHEVVNTRNAWVPDEARRILLQANDGIIDAIVARFDSLKDELGLGDRLHFLKQSGRVDFVLAECARSFDMLCVGHEVRDHADEHVAFHPDRIALVSGRPVIVVPEQYDSEATHNHAAVAWDGSRASARALFDSQRILKANGRVSILTVGETRLTRPVEEVLEHLSRHGVDADHDALDAQDGVVGALLDYCRKNDPCLLVMGAYEHSKFREDFLGGVTARVMAGIEIPVLLSH